MVAVSRNFPELQVVPPGFLLVRVLGSVSRVKVVGALLHAGGAMSGREVARRARMPASTAAHALAELCRVGLVRRVEKKGRARYAVNADHHLFPAVRALFAAEAALPDELAQFLSDHLRREGVSVRNLALSFTEGGEVLALVANKPQSATGELRQKVLARYGLEFCGFVSDPAAGSERFGVWQEFSDERTENRPAGSEVGDAQPRERGGAAAGGHPYRSTTRDGRSGV